MKTITKTFLTGLATLAPIVLTFYVLYWIIISIEHALGGLLKYVLSERYYTPGLGIVLGVALILVVGVMMRSWLAQKLFTFWEGLLYRLPLVKSIYGTLQDFLQYFTHSEDRAEQMVVAIRLKDTNIRLIGFVTRTNFEGLPKELAEHDSIAVYLPMSYMLGGYTVLVSRADVEPIGMTVDSAMRFAITAGLSVESKERMHKK